VTTPGKRRAVFPWSLFRGWRWSLVLKVAAVVAVLGVYAVGIYLPGGAVREPFFLKWAAVGAGLVDAVGIYLLWGVVRWSLFLKWAAVAVALGVCAVGILLLWGVWGGRPVAAAFTRVGGATRVETALEASRFWLTPPQLVVETPADASQQIMLEAAQCAMADDAPLLFTSQDPRRQQLVDATINDWRMVEIFQNLPEVITIQKYGDVKNCLANEDPADVAGLSTLEVPNPLIQLPQVTVRQTLAPVVVFAAAIDPGDAPDVAVGLALAAHMARANPEHVSLVVVPHYLESDLELENKLQSQHELVTGGVVLGDTPTVPEDTRALLRQLLTSTDRQGVLAQVQANLGSVGALIAALLALVGLGAAAGIAGPIVIEWRERIERREHIKQLERIEQERMSSMTKLQETKPGSPTGVVGSDWITALGGKKEVTVWLRSGRQVIGTMDGQIPADVRDPTLFRIKEAHVVLNGMDSPQDPSAKGKDVLVSVKDIELIQINDSQSEDADAD
jgi:hypothetical protein